MEQKSKVWGIASMSCGILSLIAIIVPYFGLPLGILGIIFYRKNKESGMSKAGLVTGIIGTVLNSCCLFMFSIFLIFISFFHS